MTVSTFADLKSQVAAFLNRSNLAAMIPVFVQLCETRIAYGSKDGPVICEPLRIRGMETSVDVSITGQTATLPANYLQSRRFYLNTNPIGELQYIVPDLFWKTYISSCAAQPRRFTIEGENLVFGPTPDATYDGKILYYSKFPALQNDADTNWLLQNAFGAYLHGTLAEAYNFTRNIEKTLEELTAFCGVINALNLADKADRYSGSPWQAFTDTGNP